MSLESAWSIMFEEFVPIVPDKGEWGDSPFPSPYPNPEQLLILKEEYERLSKPAKEVIELLSSPSHVLHQMMSNQRGGNISKRSLFSYLHKSGWKQNRIIRAFKDLTRFSSLL